MVIVQFARGMTDPGLFTLGEATGATLDTAIRAHQFFNLGGGGVMREFEKFRFVRRVGDAG